MIDPSPSPSRLQTFWGESKNCLGIVSRDHGEVYFIKIQTAKSYAEILLRNNLFWTATFTRFTNAGEYNLAALMMFNLVLGVMQVSSERSQYDRTLDGRGLTHQKKVDHLSYWNMCSPDVE